ncbi:MAG TPA: PAS domain-containing protein, partial [Coleofasciculaceae cyanobacterium]
MASQKASCSILDANQEEKAEIANLQLYKSALAATSCSLVIGDARSCDNPIIYCNQAFLELTGYSQDEVIGYNLRFLHGCDTNPKAIEQIHQSIREGQDATVVLKNYRKDGTFF